MITLLPLLRLFVKSVLAAELAVLVHLKSVRIILLVLLGVIVALLALCADQRNLDALFILRHGCRHLRFIEFTADAAI
jgi:hypothetical protein